MDKSSVRDIDLETQQRAWNQWNSQVVPGGPRASREWMEMERHLCALGRKDLRILEVGCGAGWLAERLAAYGLVTATDLSDAVLPEVRRKLPLIDFRMGDFFKLDLPPESFDVVVTQHVLAHVLDQRAFVARIASLLVKGGRMIMATQNRPVLERWSAIPGPYPGQLRRWVDRRELRQLLRPHFQEVDMASVLPAGDQGFLRIVNSYRINRMLETAFSQDTIRRTKEKLGFGQTLIISAIRSHG